MVRWHYIEAAREKTQSCDRHWWRCRMFDGFTYQTLKRACSFLWGFSKSGPRETLETNKGQAGESPTRQSNIFHNKNWHSYSNHHTGILEEMAWNKLVNWPRQASIMTRLSLEMQGCLAILSLFLCLFNWSTTDTIFCFTCHCLSTSCFFFFSFEAAATPLWPDLEKPAADRPTMQCRWRRSKSQSVRYCCCLWHECDHMKIAWRGCRP